MTIRTLNDPDAVTAGIARALGTLPDVKADRELVDVIARRAVALALERVEPGPPAPDGREPLELLPHDGRCLYDDERRVRERLAAADGNLLLDRDELGTVAHAIDRLGVLRFRRLEELTR